MSPSIALALSLLVIAAGSVRAAPPGATLDDARRARVDAVFAPWTRPDSPGAALSIVRDGELVYENGYGSAQLEYQVPIGPDTPFHVASVSKQFTCMAIELLARDGKLSWEDDVRRHLPEVPDFGAPITLRQLANHTSGLRDQWELLALAGWRLDDVITRDHILKMVSRQRELNFTPGAEHLYSNTGYTLLAEVVARASGGTFRTFAEERIFAPLQMTRTHVHDDHQELVPGRAYSYAPRDGGFRASVLSYANAGATSLFTTAHDLALWLRNFESGQVGGAEGIASLQQRGVLASGETIDYALGLAHGLYRGTRTVAHAGSDAGFRSFVLWMPEHRLGVALLANVSTFDVSRTVQAVVDAMIGERLAPLGDEAVAAAAAMPSGAGAGAAAAPRMDVPPEALDEFPGAYELAMGGVVTVERRGRGLVARLPDGEDSALVALSPTELRAASNGALLAFTRAPGSPAPSFSAQLGSLVYEAKRIEPLAASSLAELEGEYWSDELATAYRIVLDGHRLLARHARHPDVALYALSPDLLAGGAWFFARAAVERDAGGRVSGLRVSGGRTRNVRFERR